MKYSGVEPIQAAWKAALHHRTAGNMARFPGDAEFFPSIQEMVMARDYLVWGYGEGWRQASKKWKKVHVTSWFPSLEVGSPEVFGPQRAPGFRRYGEEMDPTEHAVGSSPMKSTKGTGSSNAPIEVSDSEGDSDVSPGSVAAENEFRKSRPNQGRARFAQGSKAGKMETGSSEQIVISDSDSDDWARPTSAQGTLYKSLKKDIPKLINIVPKDKGLRSTGVLVGTWKYSPAYEPREAIGERRPGPYAIEAVLKVNGQLGFLVVGQDINGIPRPISGVWLVPIDHILLGYDFQGMITSEILREVNRRQ
jgi:hypothetical protein